MKRNRYNKVRKKLYELKDLVAEPTIIFGRLNFELVLDSSYIFFRLGPTKPFE